MTPAELSSPRDMKIVVLTAPSGSGKTTIARRLVEQVPELSFSVSATTRAPRAHEIDGKDYLFLDQAEFERRVEEGDFVEWEEVYAGVFYGTLHSELERIARRGAALLDIDVKGALNVKRHYGDQVLTLFVCPPSLDALAERLQKRGTESATSLADRLERAHLEIGYAAEFDAIIVNDELEKAVNETVGAVKQFLATGLSR